MMKMKRLIISILSILLCCYSCKTIQYVPIESDTKIEYRDTTIYRDSIIYTPVEVVKEVVPQFDTLNIETSLATASAYVDTTTRTLKGKIENKKGITEKIKYKDRIVYRDSISRVEIPVPVEVVKEVKTHYWYEKLLWIFSIIGLGAIAIKVMKRAGLSVF